MHARSRTPQSSQDPEPPAPTRSRILNEKCEVRSESELLMRSRPRPLLPPLPLPRALHVMAGKGDT